MKKLSIVLALIMALSCFCFTAFAAEVGDACDYTALNAAIVKAGKVEKEKYTTDSVKALEDALKAANEVEEGLKVDEEKKNQKTIDDAAAALNKAITDLKVKPGPCDYKALDEALEAAAEITDTTKYTEDSVNAFTKALKAAKAVKRDLTTEDSKNQKSIDDAAAALDKAIKDLKEKVTVNVHIIANDSKGNTIESNLDHFPYDFELSGYAVGSSITSEKIIAAAKARVLHKDIGDKVIDTEKFVVSPVVVLKDFGDTDQGTAVDSVTFGKGRTYDFYVYIFEIDPVENLAQVAATELAGKVDWKGVASANTALINQVINGAKAAADSLAKADYPEIGEKKTEDAAKKADGAVKGEKVVRTPDTGASAVAGVAVVVLALSATTAVVLRKKED